MRDIVEIGLGNRSPGAATTWTRSRSCPSRRTRDVDDVSTAWQIDAFRFDIPLDDPPVRRRREPGDGGRVGKAGGLGVLNAEGLWTRYEDPQPVYRKLAGTRRRRRPRRCAAAGGLRRADQARA